MQVGNEHDLSVRLDVAETLDALTEVHCTLDTDLSRLQLNSEVLILVADLAVFIIEPLDVKV